MTARIRQLFVLLVVSVAAAVALRWWTRRADAVAPAAEWPPLEVTEPPTGSPTETPTAPPTAPPLVETAPVHALVDTADASPRWVPPAPDGSCPEGYPVKANDNSGIYHVPGGRFYERTKPERCYADPGDAAADGYRPAKA